MKIKMQRRLEWAEKNMPKKPSICINCGKEGSHFVPPCLGEDGFFWCDRLEESKTPPKTLTEFCGLPDNAFEKHLNSEETKKLP